MNTAAPGKRIAALDYGLKRIGVALSDPTHTLATPFTVVQTGACLAKTCEALLCALKGYDIGLILLGNPLHMDGRASPLSELVAAFHTYLTAHTSYPVQLIDERLSSQHAEKLLRTCEHNRKQRAARSDASVAAILLQSFLGYQLDILPKRGFGVVLCDQQTGEDITIISGHLTGCNSFYVVLDPQTQQPDSATGDNELTSYA